MCCLFGFYDYGGTLSAKQKNRIISALAISSEIRGTDATGIAYRTGTKLCIYFPKQRVYLYASTKEILNYALSSIRKSLHGPVEEIAVREGDILCLLPDGGRSRGTFSVRHLYDLRAYDWPLSGIDTTTPTGKFMLTVFGAVAELEREYILQRQREGIAIAKENGVYKGRKPIVCAGFDSVLMLWRRREITAVEAQKRLGLSPSTFYRKVREYEKQIGKGE